MRLASTQKSTSIFSKPVLCLIFLISICFFAPACEREETVNIPKPIKELIDKNTSCSCEPFIDQYIWRNETIYVLSCKGPTCDCMVLFYNEKGEQLTLPQGYTWLEFQPEAQFIRNVWHCAK